jgi:anhydro-N-acetylmuramic acid kinase
LLRRAVVEAASLDDRCARPDSLALADTMITLRHAEAVAAFLSAESMRKEDVGLAGFHGQQSRIGCGAVSPFRSATARLLLKD